MSVGWSVGLSVRPSVPTFVPDLPNRRDLCRVVYPSLFNNYQYSGLSLSLFSYTTSETSELPFSDYEYMDAHGHHAQRFQDLCLRLCNVDTEYFATLAERDHKSFVFQVRIIYDLNLAKLSALDLSAFPELRKVFPHELSQYQREDFSKSKRNIKTMPAKLVSDCRSTVITEHVDNLLFLLVWFSAKIVEVRSCVQFTTYPFLRSYCHDIAKKRTDSISKVQKDFCKLLTNSLTGAFHSLFLIHLPPLVQSLPLNLVPSSPSGRLHMRTDSFLEVKLVTTVREFDRKIHDPDFYDALPLGNSCAVMIKDGIVVQNTNVISISSKIYSVSKVSFLD